MEFDIEDLAIDVDDVMSYTTINSKEEAYSLLEFFRKKICKNVFPNDREYLIRYMKGIADDSVYFR